MSFLQANRSALIYLSAVSGWGRRTLWKLVSSAEKNGYFLSDLAKNLNITNDIQLSDKQRDALKLFASKFSIQGYLDYLDSQQISTIVIEDKKYPFLLNNIDDKPIVLYEKSKKNLLSNDSIAVVGSRNMTSYGERVTRKISQELAGCGFTIVSGFMYGVDLMAHQTALESGGKTIGVLGFGFDHFFPASFKKKFDEYYQQGMSFVTEYPPFVRSSKGTFPERDRIVAGLSLGTVVTEAQENSGTMITSRLAGEFGRGVFAVPGSIFSEYSTGTKELINQGACLIGSGVEVARELGRELQVEVALEGKIMGDGLDSLQKDLLEQLKLEPHDMDDLLKVTGKYVNQLSVALNMMELAGIVCRDGEVWKIKV